MRIALRFSAILAVLLGAAMPAIAQYASPTTLINAGLTAYKDKGPEEAMKVWIKGSPLDGSKDALNQANNLRTIETYYGNYQSADIIKTRDISGSVKVIFIVMNYATGPVFGRFIVYHGTQGWLLTRFNFNLDDAIAFSDLRLE